MELSADAPDLPQPSRSLDERSTLLGMLDYHRAVLLRKSWNLDRAQLESTLPPSDLTIAGLVHHMAFVEEYWFRHLFAGLDEREPWAGVDWSVDPDWEMDIAPSLGHDLLVAQFERSIAESRDIVDATADLDQRGRIERGLDVNLRWILVHMVEEYARHCGHADLIRQSIDGQTGD